MLRNRRLFASIKVGTFVKIVILVPKVETTADYKLMIATVAAESVLRELLSIRTSCTSPVRQSTSTSGRRSSKAI